MTVTTKSTPLVSRFSSLFEAQQDNEKYLQTNNAQRALGRDPFWSISTIEEERWSQAYPFQLRMLRATSDGGYVETSKQGVRLPVFTLPIPPEQIDKSYAFAIGVEATQGGILEEHNGIVFQDISFSGSFGVLPGRSASAQLKESIAGNIFAGTVVAAQQTRDRLNAAVSGVEATSSIVTDSELRSELKGTTGYYQMLLLGDFLETYSWIKKSRENSDIRLVFSHWKTKQHYLVTPLAFRIVQTATSALEFRYSLNLKAWKRINIDVNTVQKAYNVEAQLAESSNLNFTKILDRLENFRLALQGVSKTLRASGADLSIITRPARIASMTIKTAANIPLAASDIPIEIVSQMRNNIADALSVNSIRDSLVSKNIKFQKEYKDLVYSATKESIENKSGNVSDLKKRPSKLQQALETQDDKYDFFAAIPLSSINIPNGIRSKIQDLKDNSKKYKANFWKEKRDEVRLFIQNYEKSIGTVPSTYSAIYGVPSSGTTSIPTIEEFQALAALNEFLFVLNSMSFVDSLGDEGQVEAISYIGDMAKKSGMKFNQPKSQYVIPFPYGHSLEQLAARYLDDPDRWIEIAALNNLRAPYVDEEGFTSVLLSNGAGNQIWIDWTHDIIVGQDIYLSSTIVNRETRRVMSINRFPNGMMITVDGNSDLDRFKTQHGAVVQAFLPGTVNSQSYISIPSDLDPNISEDGSSVPVGIDINEPVNRIGGMDLALTEDMDAAITVDGDWKTVKGVQAVIQRMKVFLSTPLGYDIRRPTYGFALQAGVSSADVDAQNVLNSLNEYTKIEPSLSKALSVSVVKDGPSATISASFELAVSQNRLPVSFDISI